MKNILLIGYCHLADGFLYGSNSLKKNGYIIHFFPYLNYVLDNIENKEEIFINYIKEHNINICLWWNNSIHYESFIKMYNKELVNIYFNWDPFLFEYKKYDSLVWEERLQNKELVYSKMDIIFSCFEKEVSYFNNKNNISIFYNPPGFDKYISSYIYDEKYICDISIVCTNLYDNINEFPDKTTNITRYNIVELLYNNRDKFKFHIYGSENLKNKYPECYKEFISYDNCKYVFSNSKINLSIHPLIKELNNENSSQEYFSERLPQILGCSGLLMTNSNLTYILDKENDYVYIDENTNIIEKIEHIIDNKEYYDKLRKNGNEKALKQYQWDNWANTIISNI